MMVRWMCGVHLKSRTASAELNSQLDIECITCISLDMVIRSRLRWFGHVERKDSDDVVSAGRSFKVNEVRDKGSVRKTCVNTDLVKFGLHREWALD